MWNTARELMLAACLLLQCAPAAPAGRAPDRPAPAPYLLAAEDVITINVVSFPNLSSQVVVPPDGSITVPLLDPVDVTGRTTLEVAQLLTEKWRRFIRNPSVSVALAQKRRESVLVYGQLARAGVVEYRAGKHVLEALAELGGPLPSADLSKVTLTRKSGHKRVLDLSEPEAQAYGGNDPVLEIGDVVYVPERRTKVAVVGEVMRPGSFDHRDDMTVLDALTAAGGVRMETADLPAASLSMGGKDVRLDLDAMLRRGDMTQNTVLARGAMINVPELRNRTYVFGAVARPGYYAQKEGDRVLDALNAAGGPLPSADLREVHVVHIDRGTSSAVVDRADVEKALRKGDMACNRPLSIGDVVYVPERRKRFEFRDLIGVLSSVSIIDSAYR
ncbi:MAG TPA: SLBB domain-containing protein, partial [Chthonomonadales bacterium]|nr:SLBB domain-containing protein [Chthonomonadales bacterium]